MASAPRLVNHAHLRPSTMPLYKPKPAFDYKGFFEGKTEEKKRDGSFRVFHAVDRIAKKLPRALTNGKDVVVWCSNDYLGMSRHPVVRSAIR